MTKSAGLAARYWIASSPLPTALTSKSSSMKVSSMTFWIVTLSSASRMRLLMKPSDGIADGIETYRSSSRGKMLAQIAHDVFGRGAGKEDGVDAGLLQALLVLLRDDAAREHQDVFAAVLAQQARHLGQQAVVRPGEDREPDRVDVLLDGRHRDLLRRLAQAGVDDLVA